MTGAGGSSPFGAWLEGDPEVAGLLADEGERQSSTLQLIASENFTSPAVLAATGSILTNKYAEGYPGRRYYGGNQVVDRVEDLARDRLCALYGAEHANVQPHAGAAANLAVYQALLEPGDTVLAMRLDQGGHLTHGSPASITSKIWHFVAYGVSAATGDPDKPGEIIDFDQVADIARRERPALIVAGSTAYARIIDPLPFREIADSVGARFMYDAAHPAGLIAGGVHPSPVGIADVVTLTTHKTLRGPRGGAIMSSAELAKSIDSAAGRSARARHRGQGGRLRRGGPSRLPPVREGRGRERPCARGVARWRGVPPGVGRHRQPPGPHRPPRLRRRPDRQGCPGDARPSGHHLQSQHHPRRSPLGLRDLGTPARVRGGDHRGNGRARDATRRGAHWQDVASPRGRGRAHRHPRRGPRAVLALPAVRGARRRVRSGPGSNR